MQFNPKTLLILSSAALFAGCGSSSGSSTTSGSSTPIATSVAQAVSSTAAESDSNAIDIPLGEPDFGTLSDAGAGAVFLVGQLEDADQVFGIARFYPDDDYTIAAAPTAGSIEFFASVIIAHVTGIGTQPDGSFSAGSTETLTGNDPLLNVNLDDLNFSMNDTLSNGSEYVMSGSVLSGGALSGTVTVDGIDITADLEGQIYGDPAGLQNDAVAGAFAGNNETEILIGIFTGNNE